jgi:superfamily II DNA/RNA helicase
MGSRTHEFWHAERTDRPRLTVDIAAAHSSTIVFCRTKHGVDRLARQLIQAGITAVALHGDRTQVQRDRALAQFHARQVQVLVGTDVAARGLHVDDVGCVVHYDPPEDESTYVHRSGRTGRAGSEGVVISLVTSDQQSAVRKIQKSLGLPQHFNDPSVPRSEPRQAAKLPADPGPSRADKIAAYESPNRRRAKRPVGARRSSPSAPQPADSRRRSAKRPRPHSAA